ncbi:hypothetical protein DFH09DRAFT_1395899 [Mycena vulgaris]|nr:hypothetical protein DFH09DRAFT_1395899 [Mycena vulgaris]
MAEKSLSNIVNATTSVPPDAFSDVSGARASSSTGSGYPSPPIPPPTTHYPPPPDAPPPAGAGLPDDGRPTSTPVPGHPLLRGGNMLVYPPHYEYSRCNNTGYKHGDPTHPCSKCWDKYARPYAGALIHAPAPSASPAPGSAAGHASLSFQRPLPRIYAPPPGAYPSSPAPSVYGSPSPAPSGYASPSPGANAYAPPSRAPDAHGYAPNAYPPPPPHAGRPAIFPPGDVRLGGALCWRCGGRGSTSFLVFETIPCGACRGVGRVFG